MVIGYLVQAVRQKQLVGFLKGFGRIGCSGIDWYINQSLKPLPHMGVSEREYAWQERVAEG